MKKTTLLHALINAFLIKINIRYYLVLAICSRDANMKLHEADGPLKVIHDQLIYLTPLPESDVMCEIKLTNVSNIIGKFLPMIGLKNTLLVCLKGKFYRKYISLFSIPFHHLVELMRQKSIRSS